MSNEQSNQIIYNHLVEASAKTGKNFGGKVTSSIGTTSTIKQTNAPGSMNALSTEQIRDRAKRFARMTSA